MFRLQGLLLLLLLHWKQGAGGPLPSTSNKNDCSMRHRCSDKIMTQIKNQMNQLNSSADALLRTYNKAQGEPFSSSPDKLCSNGLKSITVFHGKGTKKDRLTELYFITKFFQKSLNSLLQFQKTFDPTATALLSALRSTVRIIRGLLSNVHCHLCNKYNVGQLDTLPIPEKWKRHFPGSSSGIFNKKRQGCQFLVKYRQVIAKLSKAF